MSTKQLTKPIMPLPVVKFFVCEDLRQELNGMVSAIGLYPDNVMVIGIPSGVPEPTAEMPVAAKSLNFLFNLANLPANTSVAIEVETNGKRNIIQPAKDFPSPGPGKSINLIIRMIPAIFHFFGERKVFVTVGEAIHEFSYEIRKVSVEDSIPSIEVDKTLVVKPKKPVARKKLLEIKKS